MRGVLPQPPVDDPEVFQFLTMMSRHGKHFRDIARELRVDVAVCVSLYYDVIKVRCKGWYRESVKPDSDSSGSDSDADTPWSSRARRRARREAALVC